MNLSLFNYSVRRGRRNIITGFTTTFNTGITVVLGPNGAGKTTLLESISLGGRYSTTGTLALNGMTVRSRIDERSFKRNTGFMPQNWKPITGYTSLDSVEYAAWIKGVPETKLKKDAINALKEVALAAHFRTKVRKLSGGMKQRVGLAESLVHKPGLVLLDEPTVGLDPEQRQQFRDSLHNRRGDRIIILSTHLTEDVSTLADFVLVLKDGSITFHGSVNDFDAIGAAENPTRAGESTIDRAYRKTLHRNDHAVV